MLDRSGLKTFAIRYRYHPKLLAGSRVRAISWVVESRLLLCYPAPNPWTPGVIERDGGARLRIKAAQEKENDSGEGGGVPCGGFVLRPLASASADATCHDTAYAANGGGERLAFEVILIASSRGYLPSAESVNPVILLCWKLGRSLELLPKCVGASVFPAIAKRCDITFFFFKRRLSVHPG